MPHGCGASLDSLMHVEDYGPSLRSEGVLLHSVATAQSTMDYFVMAVDEGVVDSPITQAPILGRLNSLSPMWPRSLPHSLLPNRRGYTSTKRVLYGGMEDVEYGLPLKIWPLSPSSEERFLCLH